jgi:hypothetical protein
VIVLLMWPCGTGLDPSDRFSTESVTYVTRAIRGFTYKRGGCVRGGGVRGKWHERARTRGGERARQPKRGSKRVGVCGGKRLLTRFLRLSAEAARAAAAGRLRGTRRRQAELLLQCGAAGRGRGGGKRGGKRGGGDQRVKRKILRICFVIENTRSC